MPCLLRAPPALQFPATTQLMCLQPRCYLQTVNWLRHGVLPVYVTEGATPEAKQALQRRRFEAKHGRAGGGGNGGFRDIDRQARVVTSLLNAMVSSGCGVLFSVYHLCTNYNSESMTRRNLFHLIFHIAACCGVFLLLCTDLSHAEVIRWRCSPLAALGERIVRKQASQTQNKALHACSASKHMPFACVLRRACLWWTHPARPKPCAQR